MCSRASALILACNGQELQGKICEPPSQVKDQQGQEASQEALGKASTLALSFSPFTEAGKGQRSSAPTLRFSQSQSPHNCCHSWL